MKINFEFNTDEYDPEAETIVPRIETYSNETELSSVLHEEFSHWFGSGISGSPNDYHALAQEIWSWLSQVGRAIHIDLFLKLYPK